MLIVWCACTACKRSSKSFVSFAQALNNPKIMDFSIKIDENEMKIEKITFLLDPELTRIRCYVENVIKCYVEKFPNKSYNASLNIRLK